MKRITVFRKLSRLGKVRPLVYFFAFLLLLFVAASSFENYLVKRSSEGFGNLIASGDYSGLEVFSAKVGIAKTYELIKARFPNNDPAAHDFAHVIGIAAYQKEGLGGLSYCDTAFNYGCMHGFMESFVAQNGIGEIAQIENACIALGQLHAPSCLHGIGHGVMIDSGYVLEKALNDCHRLQNASKLYCFDGVFMERIVQSMQAPEKKFTIAFETLDYPCNEVAYIYKSQCWRNQVTVWFQFYGGESRNAGQRCLQIESEFMPICTESVGLNVAMRNPKSADEAAAACAFIPGGIVADGCVIGVLKELMFENRPGVFAYQLCEFVSVSAEADCNRLLLQLQEENRKRFQAD